jgi:hypothetical protein
MELIGNRRLAWQRGVRALYAEIAIKIEDSEGANGSICGLETINGTWTPGIIFGIGLAKEWTKEIVDWANVSISIVSFRGMESDTTITAAAYVAFQAVADAARSPRVHGIFTLDESTGRFLIGNSGSEA